MTNFSKKARHEDLRKKRRKKKKNRNSKWSQRFNPDTADALLSMSPGTDIPTLRAQNGALKSTLRDAVVDYRTHITKVLKRRVKRKAHAIRSAGQDAAEQMGQDSTPYPKDCFLSNLENQLFFSPVKKQIDAVNPIGKNKFTKLCSHLNGFLTAKKDDFVVVETPEKDDREDFDFCDITEETEVNKERVKFQLAMSSISNKNFRLKKPRKRKRSRDYGVEKHSAYEQAMLRICEQRRYFAVDEDQSDDELDDDFF